MYCMLYLFVYITYFAYEFCICLGQIAYFCIYCIYLHIYVYLHVYNFVCLQFLMTLRTMEWTREARAAWLYPLIQIGSTGSSSTFSSGPATTSSLNKSIMHPTRHAQGNVHHCWRA